MKLRAAVALSVLATSCYDAYIVAPTPNIEPVLSANVVTTQDEQIRNDVFVFLRPGTDRNGDDLLLADSSVAVAGIVIAGERSPAGTSMRWQWSDSTTRDSLSIRLPTLATFPGVAVTARMALATRDGPAVIEHLAGQDLTLRLLGAVDSIAGMKTATLGSWRLTVSDARAPRSFRVDGIGRSSTFVVPQSVMPMVAGDSLVANVETIKGYSVDGAPFPMVIVLQARVKWIIRIVAP